jgi:hypothetical protein
MSPAAASARPGARGTIKVNGPGHVINIANNVEYISYLENGTPPHGNHPGTASHAMVDRAIIQTLQTYARKV